MSSRPRRSAALRANEAITDMAEANDRPMSSRSDRRSGRTSGATISREPPSSPDHLNLNIKVSSNKLRQATVGRDGVRTEQQISVNSRDSFSRGQIITSKWTRGGRKSYVVDSDSDDDEEDAEMEDDEDESAEHDDEEEDDEDMDALGEEDADGDADEMELDADGEADDDLGDGEGDVDMDASITVGRSSKPAPKAKPAPRLPAPKPAPVYEDDDDDDLSDPGPSDIEETITYGETMLGGDDEEDDAEGEEEEIQVAAGEEDGEDQDGEGEEDDEELDSDEEGASRAETPDLSKMTRRQRARFADTPTEYMKLSDEVQVKKVFTAEEHAMRRAEMARRRRNLSEKRTEEVKMETINKLLKKQAPKTKGRANAGAGEDDPDSEYPRPNPTTFRWVSDRAGSRIALPEELLASHAGDVLGVSGGLRPGKMVEEVQ